ncbi:MAG TPA: hypothetical protein VLA89_03220 [Gemmatimonadales bacterium]|nr:hypothetical protein [Gemmatimonadales bacterium]
MIIKAENGSFCIMDPGNLEVVFRGFLNDDGSMQFVSDDSILLPPEAVQEIVEGISHANEVLLKSGAGGFEI